MKWISLIYGWLSLTLLAATIVAQAPPLSLEAGRIDQGLFHFRVRGISQQLYRLEVSSNLVDWIELTTVRAPSELFELSDSAGFSSNAFYRATQIILGPASFRASQTNIFSGDGTTLVVNEISSEGWIFTVNGSESGNDQSGWLAPNPGHPEQVFYTAPIVDAPRDVEVCAEDRSNSSRKYCVTLRVVPMNGTLRVLPGNVILPLNGTQRFLAAIDVEGLGLVPLNRALWKVNGAFGGSPVDGAIGFDGTYVAPKTMPDSLPGTIEIGFSFGFEAPVLATANVTLATLELTPGSVTFTDNSQTAQLTATVLKSDGSRVVQGPGAVTFSSANSTIADVDQNGLVTAGTNSGVVAIKARHNVLNCEDFTIIEGRKKVFLALQGFNQRSPDLMRTVRVGSLTPVIEEIEVTAPGAMLTLNPDLYFFRGRFSSFANSIAAIGNPYVHIEGDGVNTFSYDPNGRIPQPSGIVASIDRDTGFLLFGDKPGSGSIRMLYDDGYVQSASTSTVTFTRVTLDASLRPAISATTNAAYITEWLNVQVQISNPREDSTFIGDTPIRLKRKDGGKFLVASALRNKAEGLTQLPLSLQVDETSEFTMIVPGGENPNRFPDFGKMQFSISPRDSGEMTFVLSVPNDPGIPPLEFPITILRPKLRVKKSGGNFAAPLYGAVPGSPIPVHSFVDFEQESGPSLINFSATPTTAPAPLASYDPLAWFVTRPDDSEEVIPYIGTVTDVNAFSRNFHQPGIYKVTLGFTRRPEICTEPLEVKIVAPNGNFLEAANAEKLEVQTSDGTFVPLENQVAGIQILSPVADQPWMPGAPVQITARTFNGNGVPQVIGKKIRSINQNGEFVSETVSYEIAALYAQNVRGLPDANGIYSLSYTPRNDAPEEKDMVIPIGVGMVTLTTNEFSALVPLPEEIHIERDGDVIRNDYIPLGIARFANDTNKSLLQQAVVLGGSGAVLVPQFLPVATQRLRDAVASGRLPAGSDEVTFHMRGRKGFVESLGSGLPTIDFGPAMELISGRREGDEVVFKARTDLVAFESGEAAYGAMFVPAQLASGVKIDVGVEFVSYQVETNSVDFNIPLNAAYSYYMPPGILAVGSWDRHEEGAVPLRIAAANPFSIYRTLDLELRPSIPACWDANANGLAEPNEDLDGDGRFTAADATNFVTFRGIFADQPLVGFSRNPDPVTGQPLVRELHKVIVPGSSPEFYVFGNISDTHTLDRERMLLGQTEMPDGIPDFVSTNANAEALIVRTDSGNMADFFPFTAYNLMAEPTATLPEKPVQFSSINPDIYSAYQTYGALDAQQTVQEASVTESTNKISLFVDHEARVTDIDPYETNLLGGGPVPFTFYAGLLDQFYQNITRGGGFGNYTTLFRLGHDGRVHDFEPREPGLPTGRDRRYFGIDLDGALYDAISINFPKLPPWPTNLWNLLSYQQQLEVGLLLTNRLDEAPNSFALRSIPVVQDRLGAHVGLTPQGLLRGIGGSSGGYVDLARGYPGGLMVEASAPGADFPGLHAGFPIDLEPEQLRDPVTGGVEDDIRDVLIKRPLLDQDGQLTNYAIVEEEKVLGLKQPRQVHIFGQNEDHKAPIQTGAKTLVNFSITTDPPGVTPANADLWKFRSLIALRQVPGKDDDSFLSVTTQSDGNEILLKVFYDTAVDVIADVTATAILSVMTEGAYLECGGVELGKTALNAVISLSLNVLNSDVVRGGKDVGQPIIFANKVLRSGFNYSDIYEFGHKNISHGITNKTIPIPGISFPGLFKLDFTSPQFEAEDFRGPKALAKRLTTPDYKLYHVPDAAVLPFCSILSAPVDNLKSALKNMVSAELFGGLGSARAMGTRVLGICIPKEAQQTNGLYSLVYVSTQSLEIQPKEPKSIALDELPYQSVFAAYPFADEVSDQELYRTLLAKAAAAEDPEARRDAATILNALEIKSILRVPRSNLYQPYKIRATRLPAFAAVIGPGREISNGREIGDFVLTPGRTVIPVSSAAIVSAGRANENATARASVSVPGYDMVLLRAVIRKPPQVLPGF